MSLYPQKIVPHIIPALIICIYIYIISINFVDIPTWDQFDELTIIKAYHENTLTVRQFLKCQNENPVVYYRLITIPLALISGWNLWIEEVLLFLIIIATYFSLVKVSDTLTANNHIVINIFFATILFGLGQYGNFINAGGIYLHIHLAVLCFILFSYFIFTKPLTKKRLLWAIVFGHICSWSYATGMLVWVLAAFLFKITKRDTKYSLLFLSLFVLHLFLYFYLLGGYTEGVLPKLLHLQSWKNIAILLPYYLTVPIFPQMEKAKILAYLTGVGVLFYLVYGLIKTFRFPKLTPPIYLFSFLLISYSSVIATLLTLSRFNGTKTLSSVYFTSRYLTHANLSSFAIVIVCFYFVNIHKQLSVVLRGIICSIVICIHVKNFLIYKNNIIPNVNLLNNCKEAFCSGSHNEKLMVGNISPFSDIYEDGRKTMIKYQLNCFSEKHKVLVSKPTNATKR